MPLAPAGSDPGTMMAYFSQGYGAAPFYANMGPVYGGDPYAGLSAQVAPFLPGNPDVTVSRAQAMANAQNLLDSIRNAGAAQEWQTGRSTLAGLADRNVSGGGYARGVLGRTLGGVRAGTEGNWQGALSGSYGDLEAQRMAKERTGQGGISLANAIMGANIGYGQNIRGLEQQRQAGYLGETGDWLNYVNQLARNRQIEAGLTDQRTLTELARQANRANSVGSAAASGNPLQAAGAIFGGLFG